MCDLKPRTSEVNAQLWGVRARDWAECQEVLLLPHPSCVPLPARKTLM